MTNQTLLELLRLRDKTSILVYQVEESNGHVLTFDALTEQCNACGNTLKMLHLRTLASTNLINIHTSINT